MNIQKVGFVGLGRMGQPMAKNLIKAGFTVYVWNRTASKLDDFIRKNNALKVNTPRDLANECEVVISMISDDTAATQVYEAHEGLLTGTTAHYFVEMGTLSPGYITALAQKAQKLQKIFIDAPVSGSTQAATDATLTIMAGADKATADPILPLLNAMGRKVICMGKVGYGAIMKLSVNAIIHGLNQTVSEALLLAESAGIQRELAYDVIEESAAAAPMLHYRRMQYLDNTSQPVSFALSLAKKDMRLITELATRYGLTMGQAKFNLEALHGAEEHGYGARDMASIIDYLREKH